MLRQIPACTFNYFLHSFSMHLYEGKDINSISNHIKMLTKKNIFKIQLYEKSGSRGF